MDNGWIKIHRKLFNKGWSNKPDYVALWVYLIKEATHKEIEYFWNGKTIKLQPGQFISGRNKIGRDTGLHPSKVERILKTFQNEQQIEQQKSNTSRLISIVKYSEYQITEQQTEQRVNNKRTTGEQRVNTKQEDKELKNIKKIEYRGIENIWNKWTKYKKDEFKFSYKSPESEQTALDTLLKLSGGVADVADKIVNQSITNGWKGLFKLDEDKKEKKPRIDYSDEAIKKFIDL